jgi:hypothetical protein
LRCCARCTMWIPPRTCAGSAQSEGAVERQR